MKRVDCSDCSHFIHPALKDSENLLSPLIQKPACSLGKRVMFRMPKSYFDCGGFPRYCNEFSGGKQRHS